MSLLNKILLIVVVVFSVSFSQNCKADVTINTGNDSSRIYVDSVFVDKGNAQLKLNKGKHKISIFENEREWGSGSLTKNIFISDCEDKLFSFELDNKYYLLKTEPDNVPVFDNDSLIGYTPLKLSQSFNSLRLNKKGYEEKVVDFNKIKNEDNIKLSFIGEKDEESFFRTNAFKILVGSIAVLGGTTAYFKLKADDYFDEYELTGDEKLLDKTNTYDLISGITFGALQINFGLLIYYFLIE